MSARARETARRRQRRREEREHAWREHVCGGPLLDAAEPIVGEASDERHAEAVRATIAYREARVARESHALAVAFAHGCAAVLAVRRSMLADLERWTAGGPRVAAEFSTASGTPAPGTIPAL